jgi:hypothetical protein
MRVTTAVSHATMIVLLLGLGCSAPVSSQPAPGTSIDWNVKSRFGLFKNEADFDNIASYSRAGGVLAQETELAAKPEGKGWASEIVSRLCIDAATKVVDDCKRNYQELDGVHPVTESYLNPTGHEIEVQPKGLPAPTPCAWRLVADGDPILQVTENKTCGNEVFTVPYGKTTQVQLFVAADPENSPPTATVNVNVRDILIAGLGDSTASGEGNPDRPIDLAYGGDGEGFCFGRLFYGQYWRPSRLGYDSRDCVGETLKEWPAWLEKGALWMDLPCHRSLYSYQVRVALQLAIENKDIAVTYIPLGCSGATIAQGMIGRQPARETGCAPDRCPGWVNGQIGALKDILDRVHKQDKNRNLDLVLLTVGANDINFPGLVANAMINHKSIEFDIFRRLGMISIVDQGRQKLNYLSSQFVKLRAGLKPLLGNKLDHVIYVSYGNPALYDGGKPCPETTRGFDVHPAFKIDGDLVEANSDFVNKEFFPRLKALALCSEGGGCQSDTQDKMTFVDEHQAQFKDHGFCAEAANDPEFDRTCFKDGDSFKTDPTQAKIHPLTCDQSPNKFEAYASRQRWIRTANDSYFAAMTYATGLTRELSPPDLHDPIWGVTSAVYGGALHPTAQGFAAMADAALPYARRLLVLPESPQPVLRSSAK